MLRISRTQNLGANPYIVKNKRLNHTTFIIVGKDFVDEEAIAVPLSAPSVLSTH